MAKKARLTAEQITHFEPISALSRARLEELVTLAYVERIGLGVSVFREGDVDNQAVYLLTGDVQLTSSDGSIDKVLSATTAQAKFPLDDSQPRQMSCVANGPVELLRIDNSVLDYIMMWDQLTGTEQEPVTPASTPVLEKPVPVNRAPQSAQAAVAEASVKKPPVEVSHAADKKATAQPVAPEKLTDAERSLKAKMKSEQIPPSPPKAETSAAIVAMNSSSEHDKISASHTSEAVVDAQSTQKFTAVNTEMSEPNAWMRRMHHIMAFKNMPPANIRILLDRMEQIPVSAGDTIVKQGEVGDYFYVLTDGHAKVTRTVELAELKPGASFGEESLVSGVERNASVTMLSDGVMMRLAKADFNELLKEPMLCRMSPDEARVNAAKGDIWLDVRHASEYHHAQLRKAINIPLHELRSRLTELDKSKRYICYCNTGRRSSAAAFLLVQNGFNACVLNGGVRVMPQELQKGDRLI